jgi:hypothetical protein
MTVLLDGKRIIGQVLAEYPDGTAKVLFRGETEPQIVELAQYQTTIIGTD